MTEGRVMESSSRICQLLMIHMTGGAPFGFRIASIHSDGISPFAVSTIRINGKAYRAGLLEADLVLAINGFSSCCELSHRSATKLMEYDDPELTLHILRGENLCEDDIKTSLQSLDSQIVELSDSEVQSIIAKKQLQQPAGIPVWKGKLSNSLNHLNVSPFWLQPPPNTRAKIAERRSNMLSVSQNTEPTLTDLTSNGLTDIRVPQTWMNFKVEANNDINGSLTMAQLKMSDATESNKDFQISDKLINELQNANLSCASNQTYQQSNAEQQSRWIDAPSRVILDKRNDKIISQSKSTTGQFDIATSLNVSHSIIEDRVEKAGQNVILQQQLNSNDNHLGNRYRVEQNIVFKPMDQARYYDAESGQFRENSSDKLPKRRSNSISCYNMYIGSGMEKPSSVGENNRVRFHQPDECNRFKPNDDGFKQFDGTVYQWAIGAVRDPVTEFDKGVSKSQSTSIQLPQASLPSKSNVHMSSSLFPSQQFYPTMTPSQLENSSTSHWSSNRPIQLTATPNERLQAPSNQMETRHLQQASSVHSFSPAVDNLPIIRPNSPHCLPISLAKHGSSRPLPTLICLRSNEDEGMPSVACANLLPVDETALAKVRHSQHFSDMKSRNYDATMCSLYKSRANSTFETNQQLTESEEILEPACYHSAHKPNSSINQTWPVNVNSNSLKTLLINEGKGGRLFARRRANSDAWIVGERDESNKTATKPMINNRKITEMQAMAELDIMQRRRSLTAGYLQQPVCSEIGNNPHQYRSRTAQKLVNSFSSPRPFYDVQYTIRPNCHSQSSAGQNGVNQAVQLDLNARQLQGSTSHSISPYFSQRVRPLQSDLHPTYHHAPESNRYAVQPNIGYTDL